MAYKFQLGDAVMSGSLTQEEGIVSTTMSASAALSGKSLVIEGTTRISAAGSVSPALLVMPDVTSGKFLVGDGTSYQEVALSGDATLASAGGLTIANGAVTVAKMADMAANTVLVRDANSTGVPSAKALTTTQILIGDGTGFTAAALSSDVTMTNAGAVTIANDAVSLAKMAGLVRGKFIVGDASGDPSALAAGAVGKLLVADANGDPSWTTVSGDATVSAGALTIAANAVTLAKMAGLARGSVILGDASGDPSALVKGAASTFLQSDGTDLAYVAMSGDATLTAGSLAIGATKVTDAMINDDVATGLAGVGLGGASGELFVNLNELGVATIDVASDSFAIIDSSDTNISKKESIADLALGMAGDAIVANSGQLGVALNRENGLPAAAIDVAADSILIIDANDSSNSKKESWADVVSAMAGSGLTAVSGQLSAAGSGDSISVALAAAGSILAAGLNHTATQGGAISVGLPSGSAATSGDVVYLKGNSGTSTANTLTLSSSHASTKIEGVDGTAAGKIVLESPFATVGLIYVDGAGDNNWVIF